MTDVAEELPFAAVVDDDQLDETCSNCFSHKATIMGVVNFLFCSGILANVL